MEIDTRTILTSFCFGRQLQQNKRRPEGTPPIGGE